MAFASELSTRGARWARGEDDPRARARARALVCRRLFDEPSDLLTVGPYELLSTLGRGGMGVVYEARDPRRDARFALKMLHGQSASALYHLKREFRALAALRHPNLVALHELSTEGVDAYFTMELVEGCDFVRHVRGDAPAGASAPDLARLRAALTDLCAGIVALHGAGKLHRDLKPSNVLVSSGGRVVLLDFGLVREADDAGGDVAGTPAYMAPEQAAGEASMASDWYGFGRILAEALTGREAAAFTAGAAATLPEEHVPLAQLALALTHPDPARRPPVEAVLAAVQGAPVAPGPRRERAPEPFVGREAELSALDEAFARSRERPVVALVRGESGIGKSALLRRFARTRLAAVGARVLHGRCYEREAVPFKALDGVIDALSRLLIEHPDEIAPLAQEDRAALRAMFPVLGRVPALAREAASADGAPRAGAPDPGGLRRRGFAALRALLAALARTRPLVICIDDLQWSDADSGQLLGALLCDRAAPPLLVVGSDRTDACLVNPGIDALRKLAQAALHAPAIVELSLGPLARGDALSLARVRASEALPRATRAEQEALAGWVAGESRGNPLFLGELGRSLLRRPSPRADPHARISLEALLAERLAALTPPARLMLELVAVAGRPISAAVLAHAAGLAGDPHATIDALRAGRFVHVLRREPDELLELDHDRIAAAALADVSHRHRQDLHARLARALEAVRSVHSEGLVEQLLEAGLPFEAARHARHAAHLACAALAFARAAWLFEQALTLGSFEAAERAALLEERARALAHAGDGIAAAEAYIRAAEQAPSPRAAVRLEQCAAELRMYNGEHAEGARLLSRCYRALGLFWPERRLTLWLAIVLVGLRVLLGPRGRSRGDACLQRERGLLLSAAGPSLEPWDALRAVYNCLLAIRAGERVGDPEWAVRARGARGIMRCAGFGLGARARGLREVQAARDAAVALGEPDTIGALEGQLAGAYVIAGDPRAALDCAIRFEARVRLTSGSPAVRAMALGMVGTALLELGALREAARRWPSLAHEARHHGDFIAGFWVHAHPVQLAVVIARGDRAGIGRVLALQRALRRQHPEYVLVSFTHAVCRAEAELYWGSPLRALRMLRADARVLGSGAGYGFFAEIARVLRSRVCLGAAATLPPGQKRRRLLATARADVRRLRRSARASVRGTGRLAEASLALLAGQPARARAHVDAAEALLDAADSKLIGACARYTRGWLLGGEAGAALMLAARTALEEEDVRDPLRHVAWHVPALRASLVP